MLITDFFRKMWFCFQSDRIGPDVPFTHWMLHFPSTRNKVCRKKFRFFGGGSDFRAGAYAICCSNICIGSNVCIRPGSMLFADEYAGITIENNVLIGCGVHFYVNNHRFDRRDVPLIEQGYYLSESIVVKEGAWIGANAILLPGVSIGKNSVVGAGSVVTKSIPDFCVAVGNPAKVIRTIPEEVVSHVVPGC